MNSNCDGECLCSELCPVNVFDIKQINEEKVAVPTREQDCILCKICEVNCPTKAITIDENL